MIIREEIKTSKLREAYANKKVLPNVPTCPIAHPAPTKLINKCKIMREPSPLYRKKDQLKQINCPKLIENRYTFQLFGNKKFEQPK